MLITEEGITIDGKLVPLSRAEKYLHSKLDPLKKIVEDADKNIKEYSDKKKKALAEIEKYKDLIDEFKKEKSRVAGVSNGLAKAKADAEYNRAIDRKGVGNYDEEWKDKVKNLLGL